MENISQALNVNLNTIKSYCARVTAGHRPYNERKGFCGRPKCTNALDDELITATSLRNRFLTATKIKEMIPNVKHISARTVSRRLMASNLKARKPCKKPFITGQHTANRLQWALRHQHLTVKDWGNIIYSDESSVNIRYNINQYVCRKPSEQYSGNCVTAVKNRSVLSVNVWAGFSIHGFTELVLLPKRMNAKSFVEILKHNLLPIMGLLLPEGGFLLQDNCPIHKSAVVTQFLANNSVSIFPWPSIARMLTSSRMCGR